MFFSLQRQRTSWSLMGLGLSLILLGAGVGLQGLQSAALRPSRAPAAPTALDPRLVLHRHPVPFSGTIAGGVAVDGTLWPSLPGRNTISLHLLLPGRQVARDGQVTLVLSMRGMAMRPVQATLTASSQGYRGSVALPKFGPYHAQVDATTAGGRYTGAVNLILPLTLGSLPPGARSVRPERTSV
jgi:hypothetical protein